MVVRFLLPCLMLSAAAAAPDRAPKKDPKQDPRWWAKVDKSIDRGVAWLLARQRHNGQFPSFEDTRGVAYELGMHALATLTIIKGGQPLDGAPVTKALRAMRRLYDLYQNKLKTYEAGVVLMVLDARYLGDAGRGKKGRRRKKRMSVEDRKWAGKLVLWLQRKQKPQGLWRYPEAGVDMSNTQYAALGLWSAHRLGVQINAAVVQGMLEEVLKRQQRGGKRVPYILDPRLHDDKTKKTGERRSTTTIPARGWRYMPFDMRGGERVAYPYSGSMTSAGVAVLAIGRDILGKRLGVRDGKVRRAMWEGLAWIQSNWNLLDNPGQPGNWPFYWLYGLERCARLSGVEFIGRYDWYVAGAERLMSDQRKDGSWPLHQRMRPPGGQNVQWWSDQVDTCFAILFLTRSTPEIKTPPPAITGTG